MVISFVNNKGGVLKTTLATNICAVFSKFFPKRKSIIVDLDGQGNVSATFGQHPERLTNTIIDILEGQIDIEDCVLNVFPGIDILPSNHALSFVDQDVAQKKYKAEHILQLILKLEQIYDFVFLDTPPAMSTMVSVAMRASDMIVIPFEPDQYSILGLLRIIDTVEIFRENNEYLKVLVVPTKVNSRTRLHNDVLSIVKTKVNKKDIPLSKNVVSFTTKSSASVGYEKLPIVLINQKTKYQQEYVEITKEIINILMERDKENG
ncbi:ParA family protein [Mycoplasma sp. E35C]|uniref:ParA family protein n=1 Tax=Mycoplasma sp. E35C TaxID=2801918 RepID=UPI001CA3C8E7|nr:ParA family protein [Mycoplasma sp. E35C]QZX49149.1 ParA family protein [Mycoplasma sp. E35C]